MNTLSKAAAVRSMTGYAQVKRATADGDLTVSLRAVNHRALDLHFHQGPEFLPFENDVRAALKRGIGRGHVEIRPSLARTAGTAAISFNRAALAEYVRQFRQAAAEFDLRGEPDLNAWFARGDALALKPALETLPTAFAAELLAAVNECVAAFNEVREREGEALREDILARVAEMEQQTRRMSELRTQSLPFFHERLRARLAELLAGAAVTEARLTEEAALLAERSDIEEELTRLAVHLAELRRMLAAGGEVGKRLDFLLQELNRETNTALSKSTNAGEAGLELTTLGLALKANIEKIREQGLNLE